MAPQSATGSELGKTAFGAATHVLAATNLQYPLLQSSLANARVIYVDTPPSACFLFHAIVFSNNRRPRFESFTAWPCPKRKKENSLHSCWSHVSQPILNFVPQIAYDEQTAGPREHTDQHDCKTRTGSTRQPPPIPPKSRRLG